MEVETIVTKIILNTMIQIHSSDMLRFVVIQIVIYIAKCRGPAPVSAYRPGADSVIRITESGVDTLDAF